MVAFEIARASIILVEDKCLKPTRSYAAGFQQNRANAIQDWRAFLGLYKPSLVRQRREEDGGFA